MSVKETGVFWQDEELQRRAVADGSVSNTPYLHMVIDRQNVTKINDSTTYSCLSSARYRNGSTLYEKTGTTFLNITGNYIFSCIKMHKSFILALMYYIIQKPR